ncbi:capsular exopolysaccharide synthesis family protein [Branchiibius hedensis]|uniref:non-specific protein-tyrosine kinase n=1 Tax=Branchiibius hedensis TaxID=672460 RepID=A0A2Y8ZRF8_9MICO|nr:polysaccharide biosynthesis tyrosine autokinase [Branchiibius hedensis]PWJ26139.1 capsular exopolysaccharide synthesis family protein [Branchiibius hedensis]SSA34951.1 capsular exopolysaccharide family [Branchiibius hedensis]
MTIRDFLRIMRQRWRWLLGTLLIVLIAAAVSTMLQPKTYEASARFYLAGSNGQGTPVQRDDLATYAQVVSAPAVQEVIRKQAKVGPTAAVNVNATLSDTANIMTGTASSGSAQEAAAIANATGPALAAVAPQFSQLLSGAGSVTSTAVQPATVPSSPASPDIKRTLELAFAVGLLLGVAMALLRHFMDNRVRTVEDLEALVQRPVLSIVPRVGSGQRVVDTSDSPSGAMVEAMRRLRTNVKFVNVTNDVPAVVVTSARPGDGKTTVAANLALAMSRDGHRTLLVDGDLRKPGVASAVGIDGSVGLTNVLVHELALKDVLVEPEPSLPLFVLPAGPVPPNASELLGSAAMRNLFQELVAEFDFVVFDSPPMLPVVDALELEKLAGNLILVARGGQVSRRELQVTLKALETVDANLSGTVLNYADSFSDDYGYGHKYGYGEQPPAARGQSRRTGKRG